MQVLKYQIHINAQPEKVWNVLWDKKNYKKWAAAFHAGTYYEGNLIEGEEVLFLVPEGHGMFSLVEKVIANEEVTFVHQGEVENLKKGEVIYKNAFESYFLEKTDDGTLLKVELNCEDDYAAQMNKMFPESLKKVKEFAEN